MVREWKRGLGKIMGLERVNSAHDIICSFECGDMVEKLEAK